MTATTAIVAFSLVVTTYFIFWNLAQIAMCPVAAVFLWRHRQRHSQPAPDEGRAPIQAHRQSEPPQVCRRPIGLSYAAMGMSSSMA